MSKSQIKKHAEPWPWPCSDYVVELDQDPDSGDLLMPFPPALLKQLGWKEGDTLSWDIDEATGEVTLRKT